jgi:large subunit ribosomal protein L20
MSRIKRGVTARARHKKVLKLTKGYRGSKHTLFKSANESVLHALSYAYRDRRNKKRDFHRLWIVRINAAARQGGLSYSQLMAGLKAAGVVINRKILADLAVRDAGEFGRLVALARDSRPTPAAPAEGSA